MVRLRDDGGTGLGVLRASVAGLTGYANRNDGDPSAPNIRRRYAEELDAQPAAHVSWPPERNGACWCGSGLKYKKCCLPRSRA